MNNNGEPLSTPEATLPDKWELFDPCGSCGAPLSDHRINSLQCPDLRAACGFTGTTYTEPGEIPVVVK
jgi:hypothetical protein